jgi:FkbM family methyltransferase
VICHEVFLKNGNGRKWFSSSDNIVDIIGTADLAITLTVKRYKIMKIDIEKLRAITASLSIEFVDGQDRQEVLIEDGCPIYFSSSIRDHSENLPGGSCGENMRAAYASFDKPYEPLVTAFFHLIRDEIADLNMVDVGALWGHTSLVAASLIPNSTIHLFEMNPITTLALSKNIEINHHLKANFKIQNILLSNVDTSTQVTFKHYTARYGDSQGGSKLSRLKIFRENLKSLLKRSLRREGKGDYMTLKMRVASLDNYCVENKFIPNLIKIDVEGSQYDILLGAQKLIANNHPILLVEFDTSDSANNIGKSNRDVVRLMQSLGYQCVWGDHRKRNTTLHYIDASTELDIEVNSLGIFYQNTK